MIKKSVTIFLSSLQFFVKSNHPLNLKLAFWDTMWIPLYKYEILKIISFYIIPGNLITFSTYYIEKGIISWQTYLLVVIIFFVLAMLTYRVSLKKYESVGY